MKRVLIITLALIFGLSAVGLAAGTFSGRWATDFTITTPQTPVIGMTSVLTVNYAISGWTFGSVSTLTRDGWTVQEFRADGALGAFTLTNLLQFVPTTPTFTFLRSTAAVALAGVDLETRFLVVPAGAGLRFRVGGPVDDHLTLVRATAYFGSLVFDGDPWAVGTPTHELIFQGLDLDVTMRFFSFMLGIDADFVSHLGFQDLTLTVPAFPLGIPGFTLGLSVMYSLDLDRKTVTVTPAFAVGEWVHFQPFISVADLPAEINLRLDGLRMTWAVDPRITFIYEWDAADNTAALAVVPRIAGRRPLGFVPRYDYEQRIRIDAAMPPVTFTSAFAWLHKGDMTMFPQDIDFDVSVALIPTVLSLRTGVDIRTHALHAITFGFTVDW